MQRPLISAFSCYDKLFGELKPLFTLHRYTTRDLRYLPGPGKKIMLSEITLCEDCNIFFGKTSMDYRRVVVLSEFSCP